ncbi:hypothetical protein ACFIO0_03510 [Pseudosulfitobacter sp. SM2401]
MEVINLSDLNTVKLIADLRLKIRDLYGDDLNAFNAVVWPDYAGKSAASDQIEASYDTAMDLVDSLEKDAPSNPAAMPAWEANRVTIAAAIDFIMIDAVAPHMRAGKLVGLRGAAKQRATDIDQLSGLSESKIYDAVTEFVAKAHDAAEALRDIAARPRAYTDLAGHLAVEMSTLGTKGGFATLDDMMVYGQDEIDDVLTAMKASKFWGEGGKIATFFGRIAKYLGPAVTALAVVGVVIASIAQSEHWGEVLAKGAAALGIGLAVGAVVGSATVQAGIGTALATIFAAAGVTGEVPPVAIAIAAAGLVIAVTYAAVESFNFLFDLIFNLTGDTSAMARLMAAPMSRSMGLPMARSMARGMAG